VRNSLVAALISCADSLHRVQARRFVQGLSSDELQFIAGFLGACVLDSIGQGCLSRAQWAERITCYQQTVARHRQPDREGCDREHKTILLLEYLGRSGALAQTVNS
jgi:hypothetical protein